MTRQEKGKMNSMNGKRCTPGLLQAHSRRSFAGMLPFCFLGALLLLTAGCNLPGKPDPAKRPVPADKVLSFDILYANNCAGCHGADGKLGAAPPLNDPLFRALIPKKEVERVITSGRSGTLMPAFARRKGGSLTDTQIAVLVSEIKGIPYKISNKSEGADTKLAVVEDKQGQTPKWGVPPASPEDAPSYLLPEASKETNGATAAKHGFKVFARACAGCHGIDGKGGMKVGAIHDEAVLRLFSKQMLRRLAITGRPDLGMPDYKNGAGRAKNFRPLSSDEITALVAFLAAWRTETTPKKAQPKDGDNAKTKR